MGNLHPLSHHVACKENPGKRDIRKDSKKKLRGEKGKEIPMGKVENHFLEGISLSFPVVFFLVSVPEKWSTDSGRVFS